jgi:tRNA pseudouridine38-40 synthase
MDTFFTVRKNGISIVDQNPIPTVRDCNRFLSSMPNYRLTLQFEGTNYHGWQLQPGWPTVQGAVERAVAVTTAQQVRVLGCGRTDAGVHAEEYVANFKVDSSLPPERMLHALNSRLPDDVVVTACRLAPDDFHATLDAKGKVYRYTIATGPIRPVLDRRFVHWTRHELDVEAMKQAAAHLVGEHDFSSFVTELAPDRNAVRTVYVIDVVREGRTIKVTVSGNGFLYNMVRTIAGCLMAVGRGLRPPEWVKDVRDARDRKQAFETAPPEGLMLIKVIY